MVPKQPRDFLASHAFLAWNQNNGLGAIVIGDGEDSITSSRFWKFRDKVDGDTREGGVIFPWSDRRNWWNIAVRDGFSCLTGGATFDVIFRVLSKARPPVIPSKHL